MVDEPLNDNQKYWLALGEFVAEFSIVEQIVKHVYWELTKVKPPIAQAIFSGVNIDTAMGLMKRIADAEKWKKSKRDKLQYLLDQVRVITKVRNDILHYGVYRSSSDEYLITNEKFAHTKKSIREYPITIRNLICLTQDLRWIRLNLISFSSPQAPRQFHRQARRAISFSMAL